MATDATIIVGKLDSKELEKSIEKLVNTVNNKLLDAAGAFDDGMSLMEQSLKTFAQKAKTTVTDIKDTFKQLGTTFDDFAKAMDKAAKAASSFKPGGVGGGSGSSGAGGAGGAGGASGAGDTIGDFKEQIRLQGLKVDAQKKGSDEAQREVDIHRQMNKELKEQLKSTEQKNKELAKTRLQNSMSMPVASLSDAEKKLRLLEIYQRRYANSTILSEQQQNRLTQAINRTKAQIEKMRPMDWTRWEKMTENSIDAVAKKMQALRNVQVDPQNIQQVKRLGEEYQRLSRLQADLMGKGIQLTHSNNYLAQSFGYIRNRIVYALTLGAFTNFMKQLYDIRGQYELLERSLGILVDSMEKGTQVFNELNEMAIKSPFTLIELGGAAKQLAAYNFTADELVDTTRRLADISSALGVPMERLVYNLGQIKAQGRLNARDARDFANAGLAIVPMLAQLYTETKRFGDQQVTTAQVYDMITKKMVSYQDVLSVIYKATDEGGKFFDFQARQAGTLKVQLANLSLAYNNMLNEIGKEHQEALALPLKAMRWIFKNWRDIYDVIKTVIVILGLYKAQVAIALAGTLIQNAVTAWKALGGAIGIATNAQKLFTAACMANPWGLVLTVLASAATYFTLFGNKTEEVSQDLEHFGEKAVTTIEKLNTYVKIIGSLDENSNTYKKTLEELNEILKEYGLQTIREGESMDVVNAKREQAIALIKREGVERQYANQMAANNERYNNRVDEAQKKLVQDLKNAMTRNILGMRIGNDEIRENADAIAAVIGQIVEQNIMLIADRTGEEYEMGLEKIFTKIRTAMGKGGIGLSDETIGKIWLDNDLLMPDNIITNYTDKIKSAKEESDKFARQVTNVHDKQVAASNSTMKLTERIDAYDRSLKDPINDTFKLYSKIADLVRDYAKQHNIDFNVRFKAVVPPEWMNAKDLPELQALARRFAAIAANSPNGARVGSGKDGDKGTFFTQDQLYERAMQYVQAAKQKEDAMQSEAAREKEAEKERKKLEAQRRKEEAAARAAANRAHANQVKQENEVVKALKDEISLIKEMQGNYDKLRKAGFNNYDAINIAATGYEETIERINNILKKYGITEFDAKDFAGKDINQLLDTLKTQRATLIASGKVKLESLKDLDVEINKLNVDAKSINLKKLTDSLNSELNNLKDEYELAVELDANPELAEAFKEMFNLDTSSFPHTMDEYMTKAQGLFDKIREVSGYTQDLNIFKASDKEWETWANNVGISDEKMKEIKDKFKTVVNVTKKWVEDTIRQTKDLEYKLADTNGKIAIEEEKLSRLRIQYEKETREEKKRLLELQIQDQENTIEKLKSEIFELLPAYQKVFGGVAEHSASMTRKLALQLKKILEQAKKNDDGSFTVTDPSGKTAPLSAKERGKQLDKVNKELSKTKPILDKIKEAFKKGEDGEVDFVEGIDLIGQELQKLGDLVNTIGDISESLGLNEAGKERMADMANAIAGLGQAAQGYAQIKNGQMIEGASNIIKGAWQSISTFLDDANNKIDRQITNSQRNISRLELAYKDLQNAMEDAYGTGIVGAKQLAMANKDAQLQELKRQLELEQSRKGKNRDDDRIIELTGQIKDLEREISKMGDEIVNDLLGISGVGDAMESLMDGFIEALRNGEDAMKVFDENIDNMVANMVKKVFTTKILQPWFEQQWNSVQGDIEKRIAGYYDKYVELQDKLAAAQNIGNTEQAFFENLYGVTYQEYINDLTRQIDAITKMIGDQSGVTIDDIRKYAELLRSGQPIMQENMQEISDLLKELGLMKDTAAQNNLSSLQQGIQGVTEETAGALEAYMNSVSQQVYYQSDILTQIRDAVLMIDSDVELATQSQILLQLQNNYIIMETMAALMNGWTTPNGQGIRVELVN